MNQHTGIIDDGDECTCAHIWDEHLHPGDDEEHPTSTACDVDGCTCEAFEVA